MGEEGLLPFLQADRIDDGLALDAFEPSLDHRPFRGIDHYGHARNVRFRGNQVEECGHRLFRVEKALVHVDVEDIGAALDLLARNCKRAIVIAGLDELAEFGGAGHVGPLAHHNEVFRCAIALRAT